MAKHGTYKWPTQISAYRRAQLAEMSLRRTTKWTSGNKRDPFVRNVHMRSNPPIVKGQLVK